MRWRLLRAVNTTLLALSLFSRRRDAIDPNIFEIYTRFHLISAEGCRFESEAGKEQFQHVK